MREREYDFEDSLKQFIVEPGKNFRLQIQQNVKRHSIYQGDRIYPRVKESTINNYANISHKNRLKFVNKNLANRTQ